MALPPIRTVPVGDVTLACREYGAGEPLVLVNGLVSAMDTWNPPVIEALARHFRVIVFDNRGTGCSGYSGEPFSIPLFCEDTARLMEGLGIARAHVLGFSMGACIAQELALAFPEKVDRLVLVGGDCGGSEAVRSSGEVFARLIDRSGTLLEIARRMFSLLFPAAWLAGHNPFAYCPEVMETTGDEAAARQLEAFLSWPGSFSRLYRVRAKTLVIAGDLDAVVPYENSRILAGQIPGAELVVFPGAGHGMMYQCPDRFCETVSGFLRT
ncbi:alpha/beta fold hydrolase [Methanoregula sp. UBA64]|jgi:pimeloyl-ACP methyl ester carboxylesterase|uniref:alpha/beta fold hydrolase n=1 Tax=Methanoregula sp. UBA64 TaxID=1915554 RepID=UPI0025EE178A|nr:alpha/beta fold hydrolase [Methanoregula sp. UBA64]